MLINKHSTILKVRSHTWFWITLKSCFNIISRQWQEYWCRVSRLTLENFSFIYSDCVWFLVDGFQISQKTDIISIKSVDLAACSYSREKLQHVKCLQMKNYEILITPAFFHDSCYHCKKSLLWVLNLTNKSLLSDFKLVNKTYHKLKLVYSSKILGLRIRPQVHTDKYIW